MLKLITASDSDSKRQIYNDYFPGQKRNFFLILEHYNDDDFCRKAEEYILGEFIKLPLSDIPGKKLNSLLKEFFIKLNWQLHTLFSRRPDVERGISLALLITDNNKLYYTDFGRFSAGIIRDDKLEEISDWRNPVTLNVDELGLLGSKGEDIRFKLFEFDLQESSYFIVVQSAQAQLLRDMGIHALSIKEHLAKLKEDASFGYILLQNAKPAALYHKHWKRKKNVNKTAIILLLLIIASTSYVYWGSNILDDLLHRFKLTRQEFTQNDLKEQFVLLQKEAQNLLNQMEIVPQQKLRLEKDWEFTCENEITARPVFDYKYIYLGTGNKVSALDKGKREKIWEREFDSEVEVLRVVDANRIIVILANDTVYCLNRINQTILWNKKFDMKYSGDKEVNFGEICWNENRQLDESMFLFYAENSVALGFISTGEIISEFKTDNTVSHVSEYDLLEKSIYIVEDRKLIKLNIKVIL